MAGQAPAAPLADGERASDAPRAAAPAGRLVQLTVFLAGVGTLGVEMLASRLLAPYFGTSQPIWAVVIGMTLLELALGYHYGGRLADRRPDARLLYGIVALAGLLIGLIPPLARPILGFAQGTIAQLAVGGFLGALFGVLALFAAPVFLLAMVSPFAVRLEIRHAAAGIGAAGSTAGTLAALSTIGSILGTFLTVLVLIPTLGTALSIYLLALLLLLTGALGLWRAGGARSGGGRSGGARSVPTVLLLVGIILVGALALATLGARPAVKGAGCAGCALIAEAESPYNYIQVAERESERYGRQIVLMLNEGLAIHSVYHPRYAASGDARDLLTDGGPWDYFAVAPFFMPARDPASVRSLAMLGSGAGTTPAQFLAIYGPETRIDAVEIDPEIIALGRRYFGLRDAAVAPEHPNYHTHAADARAWLAGAQGTYDVIGIDAYHQPYIPFHLTTVEFFQLTRAHLAPDGVVAVNAGVAPDGDDRLGKTIAATMRAVFPQVYIIETKRFGNQIIVGVNRDVGDGWANMIANYERLEHPALRETIEAINISEEPDDLARYPVLTDDKAPVEALVDSLIFKQVLP